MKESVKLNRISLTYQTPETEIKALENVSFTVHEGEFVSVIGPSGCGKTSILSIIAGVIKPSGGEVIFGGNSKTPDSSIGYMLQKDELFPWRTIEGNAYLPLEIKRDKDEKHRKIVENLLKKYNLWEFRKSYPYELSGGMRQRAALIRTLAGSPGLLLLDEPFSALDYQTRLTVCDDVYDIIKSEQKTAILVTHDISEAIATSDKIVVLSSRPSKVVNIHYIDTDKSLTPLKRREEAGFSKWFERLWRELNDEKK